MTRTSWKATAALLLAVPFSLAGAQRRPRPQADGPIPLRTGQTLTDSLVEGTPSMSERGRFHVYTIDAKQGQRYIITMHAADFDAFLTVARTISGITDPFATDDDHGGGTGGTDARVRFTAPQDGPFLVIAQSLSKDGKGSYTVNFEAAPAPTSAQRIPLTFGKPMNGSLDETDATADDETFYDEYLVNLRAGQRVVIEMRANEGGIDPFINFGRMQNGTFSSISTDDDGGGNLNSRLTVTAPETGEYVIRANEVGNKTGPYTITVSERAPLVMPTPQALTVGMDVNGELTDADAEDDDGARFDMYSFPARQGDRLTVDMKSDAFDTYLSVGRMDGDRFVELESNDDSGDGTNSSVTVAIPSTGTYVIRAKGFDAAARGNYTVRVSGAER